MTIHHAALARMLPAEKKEKLLRQLAQSGVSPSRIPIIKADPAQAIPLSFNQERLWFLQKYDSTATNYNLYVVYRLHGVVDMPMLTEALRHVQARHAILRTRIIVRNDRPCQVIDDASSLVLDTVTLAAQAPTSALDAVIQQVINTRFDLARGPLWGVTQIIQPDQGCHLVFCAHHIIIDGISLRLLFDELQQQSASVAASDLASVASVAAASAAAAICRLCLLAARMVPGYLAGERTCLLACAFARRASAVDISIAAPAPGTTLYTWFPVQHHPG